jgi:hypothetical protein
MLSTMEQWVERRDDIRERVSISGTVVSDEGLLRISVSIMNLSRSGLMVRALEGEGFPHDAVVLFEHRAEPCRKIWSDGSVAGFLFLDP